jgi:type 1 glutamine amidotransferase
VFRVMSTRLKVRALLGIAGLAAGLIAPIASATDATGPGPIRVLVFSKPYAFAHTPAINRFVALTNSLNAQSSEFQFTNTTSAADLSYANLEANYDVLIWNNSTGQVSTDLKTADQRSDLLKWIREGHGFVGIHSAADSNYDWPQFIELAGGLFHYHYYDAGGSTSEPQTELLKNEDPNNPIMTGVPTDWMISDETYDWQVDPRADVHVLLSLENSSIYEGPLYEQNEPLEWCRPFGAGRTFYTNLAHSAYMFDNPVFVKSFLQGLRYTAGTLQADCSVPGTAGRQEAVWSDGSSNVTPAVSTDSGGMAVLTKLTPGSSTVTWNNVDLTGVTSIDVRLGSQTIGTPASGSEFQPPGSSGTYVPSKPSSGGTVNFHLDSATGPVVASAAFPTPNTWATVTAPVTATTGAHTLVLTFDPGSAAAASAADGPATDLAHDGSIAWIHLNGASS